jgi:hypothetical protein
MKEVKPGEIAEGMRDLIEYPEAEHFIPSDEKKHLADTWQKVCFEMLVDRVLIQNQQLAAGCSPECDDTPWNCGKAIEDMPVQCNQNFIMFLDIEEHDFPADHCQCCLFCG